MAGFTRESRSRCSGLRFGWASSRVALAPVMTSRPSMSITDPAGSGVAPFEPEHRASNENVVEGDGTGY
jgi:hypothetical protein